jgi:general secretion pathway protein B
MSYILDALKKAESERERGVVPGLGTAQTSQSTYISYGGSHKPLWLVALALAALLAAAAAIWAWRQAVVHAPSEPVAVAKPAPAVAQESPQTTTEAAVPLIVASASRSTVVPVVAKVAASTPGPLALPPALPAPAASAPPSEAAAKSPPAPAPQARAASSGVVPMSELPDSVRRQIPALNISGAIYSDAPPEWTLIINDQVLSKGSQVAPDLRLEDVSANSAVFNFKGQRFRVDR